MNARRPKILLAPMNFAGMPVTIAKALRQRGYEATQLQYIARKPNVLGYESDRLVDLRGPGGRIGGQIETVAEALGQGYDIFHFWNRSLTYRPDYGNFSGVDIPLIKARGRRIAYRFTGYDLRLPSRDLAVNPHSPFRYDQHTYYDEDLVKAYQDFLAEHVDRFIVQDPEMGQFWPGAEIIPRALDLDDWSYVGVGRPDRPLVVHAPTNGAAKGTRFILAAVEQLRGEGLKFDFELIQGLPHAEARQRYQKADIVIDAILSGAAGVITMEAWALGKPVLLNLRRDLFEPFYETTDLPVIQADPTTVVDSLRRAIKDADLRQDLSKRGRALVEARHDIAKVVDQFIDLYDDMYRAPIKTPTGDGDLRYFAMQMRLAERAEGFWRTLIDDYRSAYKREMAVAPMRVGAPRSAMGLRLRAAKMAAAPLLRRDWRWVKGQIVKLYRGQRASRSGPKRAP